MNARSSNPALKWMTLGVAVVGAIGAGAYLALQQRSATPSSVPVAPTAPAVEEAAPAIAHPIEPAPVESVAEPAEPLPALTDSDPAALAALGGITGLRELLVPEHVIERIVATVDNLPRRRLAPRLVPFKPATGTLATAEAGARVTLSADNYARYDPYVRAVGALDTPALVGHYVRLYPLFQQASRELG